VSHLPILRPFIRPLPHPLLGVLTRFSWPRSCRSGEALGSAAWSRGKDLDQASEELLMHLLGSDESVSCLMRVVSSAPR
jgi:hypothetical protein